MNWHRAKTILIYFFLVVNAFLLYFNISQNRHDSRISGEIIDYTAEILKGNGIDVNPDLIPKKKPALPQFEADNIIGDYEVFAKTVLGEDVQKISDTQFAGDKGRVDFAGDTFTFISSAPIISVNPSKAEALAVLNDLGLAIGEHSFQKADNRLIFTNKANNYEIFNSQLVLEADEQYTKISGAWFFKLADNFPADAELKDITSVLIDLLSTPEKPHGDIEISKLTLGYMIYESDSYHKTIVPIPVWQIEHTDGVICLDARAN